MVSSRVKAFIPLWICLVGAGAVAAADQDRARWEADVAAHGVAPEGVVYPFAVSEQMVGWAEAQLEGFQADGPVERLMALQDALFGWKDDQFEYVDTLTLTATEAFEQRRGNCMSFTALFVGLARGVGVPTNLVAVEKAPGVERSDELVVVNRHVVAGYRDHGNMVLFDFNLTSEAPVARHEVVEDVLASAMYHANIGGSAIRDSDLATAQFHLDLATRLAPDWGPGWVNLGVVRYRRGDLDGALSAYRKALEVEPEFSSAFANIAVVQSARGNQDEARVALEAATQHTPTPYALIAMADLEIEEGNYEAAHTHLRRARWWYEGIPEVYEGLARLARAEGDPGREQRYRDKASSLRQTESQSPPPPANR